MVSSAIGSYHQMLRGNQSNGSSLLCFGEGSRIPLNKDSRGGIPLDVLEFLD